MIDYPERFDEDMRTELLSGWLVAAAFLAVLVFLSFTGAVGTYSYSRLPDCTEEATAGVCGHEGQRAEAGNDDSLWPRLSDSIATGHVRAGRRR